LTSLTSSTSSNNEAWARYLAELEQRLEIAEAGLSAGVLAVEPFAPPAGLGPLPLEFEHWAQAVLARNQALEATIEAELARVAGELAESRRRRTPATATPARPAYFDRAI